MFAKTKIIQKKLLFRFALVAAILGLAFFNFKYSKAEVFDCDTYLKNNSAANTSCNQLTGNAKDKCELQDEKIKSYCNLWEIKSKQGNALQKQMTLIDAEQARTQIDLLKTKNQAENLAQQIDGLDREIADKENSLNYQKLILSGMMRTYYEYYQQGLLGIVLINKDFSDVLSQFDYMDQSSARVKEILGSIQNAKEELEKQQNDLEQKKQESDKLKRDLEQKKQDLLYNENQKQSLLTQTQGEEAKYQQLLARVEQQKLELLGDINDLYVASSSEFDALVEKAPSKYWALTKTNWYYSQKDSRWGNNNIGVTSYKLKDLGCAISSVAMVFTYYEEKINPGQLAKKDIFLGAVISWPYNWNGIKLITNTNHSGVNWKTIDNEINNKNPVIIFVCAKNCGSRKRAGHYVVIHTKTDDGKYVVHDPYFGSNIYLDSTMKALGKMYNTSISKNKVDQMIIYK